MSTAMQYSGFGSGPQMSPGQLEELVKALAAGNAINAPAIAPGEGFALRVESLEKTLKSVTYRMEHIRLFKALSKQPAYNTVEEYNEISSYGVNAQPFVAEGALPIGDDSTYARRTALVKYLGTTRSVTHPMSMVRPAHGNVIANETVSGTMWLVAALERALFRGNATLSALQFDGFDTMIAARSPAANSIDLRGGALDEDILIDSAMTIGDAPNFGIPTHLHLNPRTHADLVKTLLPRGRFEMLNKPDDGQIGLNVASFMSPMGAVKFEPNVFIDDGGPVPAGTIGPAALIPGSPTVSTAAAAGAPGGGEVSLFTADDVGSYRYTVTAHNDAGSSAPVVVSAGLAVAAGQRVTFGLTPAAGNATRWFQIYRSRPGGAAGELRLIDRVAAAGGAQTIIDLNNNLPFTTSAYMWQQNPDCLSWKQLAPMIKIPLATIDASIRWMQLIYGVPVLYTPGRAVRIRNIGRPVGVVGTP